MSDLGRGLRDLPRRAVFLSPPVSSPVQSLARSLAQFSAGPLLAVAVSLLLGLSGCQEVGSGAVMTSSMYADLSVLGLGDGMSRVQATLRIGSMQSATLVELQPGDTLTASSGARMQKLERTIDQQGGFSYTGSFVGDAAGTPFSIAFTRQNDVSAPSSQTVLPSPVTHLMPASGTTVSRAQSFMITWDAGVGSSDLIDVSITGPCVIGLSRMALPDTGQVLVAAAQIKNLPDMPGTTCSVQIAVARKRKGTVDPAFGAGGAFYGIQQSMGTINSVP